MKIPLYVKCLKARRLWRVMRSVVVVLRRRIAMKGLQKMVVYLHMKYHGGHKFMNIKSIAGNLNDHYEFSCSSSPSNNSSIYGHGVNSGSGRSSSRGRFSLGALMPSCTRLNVKDEMDSKWGNAGIPEFIACDKDDDHYFSDMDSNFSANSYSNELSSESYAHVSTTPCSNCSTHVSTTPCSNCSTHVSTTPCSNCSLNSEIDKQAEEFIAIFYQQMRLQRRDSFGEWEEMLARGSS